MVRRTYGNKTKKTKLLCEKELRLWSYTLKTGYETKQKEEGECIICLTVSFV